MAQALMQAPEALSPLLYPRGTPGAGLERDRGAASGAPPATSDRDQSPMMVPLGARRIAAEPQRGSREDDAWLRHHAAASGGSIVGIPLGCVASLSRCTAGARSSRDETRKDACNRRENSEQNLDRSRANPLEKENGRDQGKNGSHEDSSEGTNDYQP